MEAQPGRVAIEVMKTLVITNRTLLNTPAIAISDRPLQDAVMSITCTIAADSSITITAGGLSLISGYPAIDGVAIRAVAIERTADTVVWTCADGNQLELQVSHRHNAIQLRVRLRGWTIAPRQVAILQDALIHGAVRGFRMAQGFGGGSRWCELPAQNAEESNLIGAFASDSGESLIWHTPDIERYASRLHWQAGHGGTRVAWTVATEGIPLPTAVLDLPVLYLSVASNPWSGLTAAADAVAAAADITLPKRRTVWCSWYYFYHHFTRADLDEVLAGLQALPDRGGITTVQIDAGYSTSVGDWLEPNQAWPGGLQDAFAAIRRAGFEPGIWVGPYMAGSRSRLATEHPDWLLRDTSGSLLAPMQMYGQERLWGYRDEEYHVVDTSHPDAFSYLQQVFTTLVAWGATYFKTDFLYWGQHDSTTVQRARPGQTSVTYMRDLLHFIRAAVGPQAYWLGCIAPYGPTLGLVDGTRIAGDVGPSWNAGFGPRQMLEETSGTQIVNERWFHNDPDAVLVRDFHNGLTAGEVRSLALWQGMMAGNLCTSDPLHRCAPERLSLWRFIDSRGSAGPAIIPGFGGRPRPYLLAMRVLTDGRRALLALNPSEHTVSDRILISDLGRDSTALIREWGPEGVVTSASCDSVHLHLEPHAASMWLIGGAAETPAPLTLSG